MAKYLLLFLLTTVTISGKDVVIHSEGYRFDSSQDYYTCAIIFTSNCQINHPMRVQSIFGKGNTSDLILDYLRKAVPHNMSTFSRIDTSFYRLLPYNCRLPKNSFDIRGKSDNTLKYPSQKMVLDLEYSPEYIVFFEEIKVDSKYNDGSKTMAAGVIAGATMGGALGAAVMGGLTGTLLNPKESRSSENVRSISIEGEYAIWDNIAGTLVSKGFIKANEDVDSIYSLQTWNRLLSKFISKIVAGSTMVLAN